MMSKSVKRKIWLIAAVISSGSLASCNINGQSVTVSNGSSYVDGVNYSSGPDSGAAKQIQPGKTVEHIFAVSGDFNSVMVDGFMNVVYTQSSADNYGVKASIPENLINLMEVAVKNNTLYISMKRGSYKINLKREQLPIFYVSNAVLQRVSTSGSGDFSINGVLVTDEGGFSYRNSGSGGLNVNTIRGIGDVSFSISGSGGVGLGRAVVSSLSLDISGSGDFSCDGVNTKICNVNINGSGDAKLSGTSEFVDFSIGGSGDINAGNLSAKSGRASATGSGDISCNVEKLSKKASGSGDITNRF